MHGVVTVQFEYKSWGLADLFPSSLAAQQQQKPEFEKEIEEGTVLCR